MYIGYPKSLAANLHSDSVMIEGADRGMYADFEGVNFEHFDGISPRRYRELFERTSRKKSGEFQDWINGVKQPIIDLKFPFYLILEREIVQSVTEYLSIIKMPVTALEKAAATKQPANSRKSSRPKKRK